ncbi:TPA: hypothetical protein O5T86_001250 [Staphylococcus aureus]|nr:hypothetical protein [Staphylococcus aureus]HDA7217707.1 hypothetical protein [Staphylococcus aureus]HDA7234986.1 hypothetical protein [Staphylococcus aureus]HDA7236789.1 hypothetical protein [Staphylococcus aureus]HDA7239214.1 hypothetical protein [Staphylococcus aureus]
MPNPSTPNGAVPVRTLTGPYNGATNAYSTAAGDSVLLGIGDFVKLVGTSQLIGDVTYADVARAATGDVIVGVVTSVVPTTRDSTVYRAASTATIVNVADDPALLFEIQESAAGTAFTANDISLNANFVVANASTTTGLSATTLDNTTEATTNTLDLKIVGLANKPNNAVGESAKWIVKINRHQFANQVAGV